MAELQAQWRAVFGTSDDPDEPYGPDPTFKERMDFAGNTFQWTLSGKDPLPSGPTVNATISGWYWCGDQPEVPNKTVWFVLTSVQPEGSFGWETGFVFTADVLFNGTIDPTGLLLGWYDGVVIANGPPYGGTAPYCRIGENYYGKACTDPFVTTFLAR